jgi:hypothetical protein
VRHIPRLTADYLNVWGDVTEKKGAAYGIILFQLHVLAV